MSIECGYLIRKQVEGKPTVFHGEIDLAQIAGEFYLIPHAEKRDPEKSPDYAFKIRGRSGDFVHFGNAWRKPFKKQKGDFFSITIDGPGMDRSVTVNAWPSDQQPDGTPKGEPANYDIKWQRPKPGAAAVVGGGSAGEPIDDEIPF